MIDEKTKKLLAELSAKTAKRLVEYEKSVTERNSFIDETMFKTYFPKALKEFEDGKLTESPKDEDFRHLFTNHLSGVTGNSGKLLSDELQSIEAELEAGRKEFIKNYKF